MSDGKKLEIEKYALTQTLAGAKSRFEAERVRRSTPKPCKKSSRRRNRKRDSEHRESDQAERRN